MQQEPRLFQQQQWATVCCGRLHPTQLQHDLLLHRLRRETDRQLQELLVLRSPPLAYGAAPSPPQHHPAHIAVLGESPASSGSSNNRSWRSHQWQLQHSANTIQLLHCTTAPSRTGVPNRQHRKSSQWPAAARAAELVKPTACSCGAVPPRRRPSLSVSVCVCSLSVC